jgi:Uma2 family endonuclease
VSYFIQRRESLGLRAVTEQRVQVKATRFRVPDVCVVRSNPRQQILTRPPFLCVEVLSPEDSLSSIKDRIEDYLAFGVENIWIVDPQTKKLYWADAYGTHEAPDSVLETQNPSVRVDFKELWPE